MIEPESKFKEPFFVSPEEKKELITRLREILSQREEIIFAYLFGSLVEGESFHDVDVAIYGEKAFSLYQLFELVNLLESEIGYPIDLIDMRRADLGLKMHIFSKELLLFSRDEELRTDLMEECARKYPEYVHFRNLALGIEGLIEI